jgi:sec-independent protein translocase protein TatB
MGVRAVNRTPMFDFAWSELMLIGIVALIVIGPKDLPRVLRTAGKWVSQARAVAREFQGSIDQMIRESELEDVRREVEKVASTDIGHQIEKSIDPKGELQGALTPPEFTDGTTPALAPPEPAASANGAIEALEPPAATPEIETSPETASTAPDAVPAPEAVPEKTKTPA